MMGDDLTEIVARYDLIPPIETFVLPNAGGINNRIRGVRTGTDTFVWKMYLSHPDADTIRYEHRLLAWLAGQGLSFATPRALTTRAGDTLCRTPGGTGWQALFPYLPGEPTNRNDPAVIEAVGAALGELHGLLARYPTSRRPGIERLGVLDHIHPAVPAPFTLTPAHLHLPPTAANDALLAWWRATLDTVRAFITGPYVALPRQVIHGDYGPGNTLTLGKRIVAVLDFDFAAPDARAMDVAEGLKFSMRIWERDTPTALMMAHRFCRGYARTNRLTTAEIAALPDLMLLYDAVSVIWWAGRGIVAGDPRAGVERIADMRAFVDWQAQYTSAFHDAIQTVL